MSKSMMSDGYRSACMPGECMSIDECMQVGACIRSQEPRDGIRSGHAPDIGVHGEMPAVCEAEQALRWVVAAFNAEGPTDENDKKWWSEMIAAIDYAENLLELRK